MNGKIIAGIFACIFLFAVIFSVGCVTPTESGDGTVTITDIAGRDVVVPDYPQKIAISGPHSTKYFAWLGVTEKTVAVDYLDSDQLVRKGENRPYMIAKPEIKNHLALGTSKGVVDAEKLMLANPEVLFMSGVSDVQIQNANEITEKTGIPVVLFYSGNYVTNKVQVDESIKLIAKIMHKEKRAEELIKYFDDTRADLELRVAGIPDEEKPTVYICGISCAGAHGMTGTDPTYYAFTVLNAKNVASGLSTTTITGYAEVAKEQILEWDPDIIFIDLDTFASANGGAIYELNNDPSYNELKAVKSDQIYAVNPMGANHETYLANAYYIGKVLYPEQFADIDPEKKADEIYTFIDGAPVYQKLKTNMYGLSYQKIVL